MDENIKPNSLQAWVLAARPKTLTAASIPVMIGCALAEAHGHFQLVPAILCFLFAFLMQIDANFINDLYDFLKGSDREDRLGPERACAQGWITPKEMKRGILLTTLLAGICGLGLPLRLSLYKISLSRLGRHLGVGVFRFRACRMHLLRNGTYVESPGHHRITRQRAGHRHAIDGQQLPRQGAG